MASVREETATIIFSMPFVWSGCGRIQTHNLPTARRTLHPISHWSGQPHVNSLANSNCQGFVLNHLISSLIVTFEILFLMCIYLHLESHSLCKFSCASRHCRTFWQERDLPSSAPTEAPLGVSWIPPLERLALLATNRTAEMWLLHLHTYTVWLCINVVFLCQKYRTRL